jgi:hypothetical protein
MLRRTLTLVLLLALLAAPAAVAQTTQQQQQPPGGAFGPLPQTAPTATATPAPAKDSTSSDLGGARTLYVIGAALPVAFVGIGMFISRDARRSLPKDHRPDSHRLREEGPHKHKREAKAKARDRGKAQKAARRKNR